MISRRVIPMGTSIRPVFLIFPVKANTFVPFDFSVPYDANQDAPLVRIAVTFAKVSTLLMMVGLLHNPFCVGNGGFARDIPRNPSIDAMSAVSSPQTNAPTPSFTRISKLKPVLKIFLPRYPPARACFIAIFNRSTARGYSARIYTYPFEDPIAYAPIIIPSRTECGLPSITARSMNAPGSPSSALQMMYFSLPGDLRPNSHFNPVGKPAPPLPRKPDVLISSMTCSGVIEESAFWADA